MTADYDEPEVITFTSAAVTIGAYSALASGQAIGEVFDLELRDTESSGHVMRLAVPGARATVAVGSRGFTGRVVIADPQDLVLQVEAEEN